MMNERAILKPCTDVIVLGDRIVKDDRSKFFKLSKKALKEVKKRDNPLISINSTEWYIRMINKMMVWRRKNGISAEGSELLLYVYSVFKEKGSGVTSYMVCNTYYLSKDVKGSELQNCRKKLVTLEKRGMLSKLGKSAFGSYVYVPSVKAIEEISEFIYGV